MITFYLCITKMKSALQSHGNTLHYLYIKLKFTGLRRNNTHIRIEAKVFFSSKKIRQPENTLHIREKRQRKFHITAQKD